MGAQSTRYISRREAISHLTRKSQLFRDREWAQLEKDSREAYGSHAPDILDTKYELSEMVHKYGPALDKWTCKMLENAMELPYIRYSSLDNYIVTETGEEP